MARARDGDHDAFASLAATSIARLLGIARGILTDADRAEDAVQDALLVAWRDVRALRDVDRFDAWLYRLVVRSCYRHAGRERRRTVVEMRLDADGRESPVTDNAILERDRIERGFQRLSADQRAVLVLHHQLGLELAEIAEILGIPLGTAKSRMFRGSRAMRAAIQADDRGQVVGKGHLA